MACLPTLFSKFSVFVWITVTAVIIGIALEIAIPKKREKLRAATDKKITLIGANQPIENLTTYFGPYRIALGDLVILTMCEEPMCSAEKINSKLSGLVV